MDEFMGISYIMERGDTFIFVENDFVCFEEYGDETYDYIQITREEAIAAARAILKHFGEE